MAFDPNVPADDRIRFSAEEIAAIRADYQARLTPEQKAKDAQLTADIERDLATGPKVSGTDTPARVTEPMQRPASAQAGGDEVIRLSPQDAAAMRAEYEARLTPEQKARDAEMRAQIESDLKSGPKVDTSTREAAADPVQREAPSRASGEEVVRMSPEQAAAMRAEYEARLTPEQRAKDAQLTADIERDLATGPKVSGADTPARVTEPMQREVQSRVATDDRVVILSPKEAAAMRAEAGIYTTSRSVNPGEERVNIKPEDAARIRAEAGIETPSRIPNPGDERVMIKPEEAARIRADVEANLTPELKANLDQLKADIQRDLEKPRAVIPPREAVKSESAQREKPRSVNPGEERVNIKPEEAARLRAQAGVEAQPRTANPGEERVIIKPEEAVRLRAASEAKMTPEQKANLAARDDRVVRLSAEEAASIRAASEAKAGLGGASLKSAGKVVSKGAEEVAEVAKKGGVAGYLVAGAIGAGIAFSEDASGKDIAKAAVNGALPGSVALANGKVAEAVAQISGFVPGLEDVVVRPALRGAGLDVAPSALANYKEPERTVDDLANDGAGSIAALKNLSSAIESGIRALREETKHLVSGGEHVTQSGMAQAPAVAKGPREIS